MYSSRIAVLYVYRQTFEVIWIFHFEPSLDALSLRSDVMSSIKMLSFVKSGPARDAKGWHP